MDGDFFAFLNQVDDRFNKLEKMLKALLECNKVHAEITRSKTSETGLADELTRIASEALTDEPTKQPRVSLTKKIIEARRDLTVLEQGIIEYHDSNNIPGGTLQEMNAAREHLNMLLEQWEEGTL